MIILSYWLDILRFLAYNINKPSKGRASAMYTINHSQPPKTMTPATLKAHVTQSETGTHFFDADTMRFFGDTMKNYGVRSFTYTNRDGYPVDCWELYRKSPVKHGAQDSAFFRKDTYRRVFPSSIYFTS